MDLAIPDLKQLGDHCAARLESEWRHLQDAEAQHVHRPDIAWVLEEDDCKWKAVFLVEDWEAAVTDLSNVVLEAAAKPLGNGEAAYAAPI